MVELIGIIMIVPDDKQNRSATMIMDSQNVTHMGKMENMHMIIFTMNLENYVVVQLEN